MDSQTRIGACVIGVLLVLFLGILYSRFRAAPPELNIPSTETSPVASQPQQAGPRRAQPTIVKQGSTLELPPEALNPQIGSPIDLPPVGPEPGALIPERLMAPAEYEARRMRQWPVPSPLDARRFQLPPMGPQ